MLFRTDGGLKTFQGKHERIPDTRRTFKTVPEGFLHAEGEERETLS